jgi:BT1 family
MPCQISFFGVQYLPIVIMMVYLVPAGSEGASYALFTTTWNVASSRADSLSTMLLGIWDVNKPTSEA